MICVPIKGPSFEEAYTQIRQAIRYADMVELRLDYFDTLDFDALKRVKRAFAIPMIFALKGPVQGGCFKGLECERLALIRQLAELKPEYIDLESHIDAKYVGQLHALHPEIRLIISYHDYKQTPEDIFAIFNQMPKESFCLYKIAVTANSSNDAIKFMQSLKTLKKQLIGVSMGAHGRFNRILQPVTGGYLTYACLQEDLKTAPGQLTAETLINCYHYRALNERTEIFGLIGDPVELSLSHQSHNHCFRESKFNAVYVKMTVKDYELHEFLRLAKRLPFSGLSVTMPLKEIIMPFLDYVDEEASKIGACNTLVFKNGRIEGYNTDGIGALNAIEKYTSVEGKRVVIIGAGGAGKAIIYEASRRRADVVVLTRGREKAKQAAKQFGCKAQPLEKAADWRSRGYDILINCTPVEMPLDEELILPGALAMDIKTRPKDTRFLTSALKKGCKVVYGYEMFIEQALGQFKLWFKDNINEDLCRKNIERKLLEHL